MNLRDSQGKRPSPLPGFALILCAMLAMAAVLTVLTSAVDPAGKALARDRGSPQEQVAPANMAQVLQQKRLAVLRRSLRMRKNVAHHGCGSITLAAIPAETIEVPSLPYVMHIEVPGIGGIAK